MNCIMSDVCTVVAGTCKNVYKTIDHINEQFTCSHQSALMQIPFYMAMQ